MLEAYLAEMREELSKRLPSEDVAARLAEVEVHLREGIEGRIELGLDAEEAEREAIRCFGASREIGRSLSPRPSCKLRIGLLAAGYGVGVLLLLLLLPVFVWKPWGVPSVFAVWIGIGIAFAVASYRARRPAPLPIAVVGVAGAIAVWLSSASWVDLGPKHGRIPWNAVGQMTEEQNQEIARRQAQREEFVANLRKFQSQGIDAFKESGEFRAPLVRARWSSFDRLEYGYYADPRRAEHAWNVAKKGALPAFDASQAQAFREALRTPSFDPGGSLSEFAPQLLPPNVAVAAFAVSLDLLFSGLGTLVFTLRRRSRKGGLYA